jgi:hypothetical protein
MARLRSIVSRVSGPGGSVLLLWGLVLAGCDGRDPLASAADPVPPNDSVPSPVDSLAPPDSAPAPPVDTTTPPPPNPPPPDTTGQPATSPCGPIAQAEKPSHSGLAFGPIHTPPASFDDRFSGTQISGITMQGHSCLVAHLAAARKANVRVFINLTGNEVYLRDEHGFSMAKWKARVDRFRNDDIGSYIEDGTIMAHLLVDEPDDRSNWNGDVVTHAEIEEMARYSKEIWPNLPTYIRATPEYLKGGQFPHLDALWFHYVERFGPIDGYIASIYGLARELGLTMIGGLNVLNGGSKHSGIPGKSAGKYAMSADELRSWGGKLLDQPGQCAFLLWQWADGYQDRPAIQAALQDLAAKARNYPIRSCRKP